MSKETQSRSAAALLPVQAVLSFLVTIFDTVTMPRLRGSEIFNDILLHFPMFYSMIDKGEVVEVWSPRMEVLRE